MSRIEPHYLILGEILRPHGIKGELRMRVMTDYPERLMSGVKRIYLGTDPNEAEAIPYSLKSARFHQDYLLLTIADITDRNEAEALKGQFVMIDIDHAIPLEDDEYYAHEIIGLKVKTVQGIELGIIKDVLETGANDVYIVSNPRYGELLLPAHAETIVDIDFDAEIVTMNLPDGILPDTIENA